MTGASPAEPWTRRHDRIAWALVALGVALRVARHLADPAPYGDEAAIVLNVADRGFAALAGPLDWNCGAPIGWLWLQRCVVLAFGSGERAMRLLPLASGCAAVALMRPLVRRLLAPAAGLVALCLFAVSWRMTDYSAIAKPYATDVALAVLCALLALRAAESPARARWTALAVCGCAAIALSHAAAFVLGGVAAAVLLGARRGDGSARIRAAGVVALWVACLAATWTVFLRPLATDPYLQRTWAHRFAPMPPASVADLVWYPVNLDRVFGLLFAPPVERVMGASAIVAATFGVRSLARRDAGAAAVLALPLVLVLVASMLRAYPFAHRLVFFLVPAIAILAAEGAGLVLARLRRSVAAACACAIVAVPLAQAAYTTAARPEKQDVRRIAAALADATRPGDVVYVQFEARAQFEHARRALPAGAFRDVRIVGGRNPRESPGATEADIDALAATPRVWTVFSFPGPEELALESDAAARLASRGRELARVEAAGAAARLYELAR